MFVYWYSDIRSGQLLFWEPRCLGRNPSSNASLLHDLGQVIFASLWLFHLKMGVTILPVFFGGSPLGKSNVCANENSFLSIQQVLCKCQLLLLWNLPTRFCFHSSDRWYCITFKAGCFSQFPHPCGVYIPWVIQGSFLPFPSEPIINNYQYHTPKTLKAIVSFWDSLIPSQSGYVCLDYCNNPLM